MCGIFFSLSRSEYVLPDSETEKLLRNRGPDHKGTHRTTISATLGHQRYATFVSTVLALRGSSIVEQPLLDSDTGSALCWNGEAWSVDGHHVHGNDTRHVFNSLLNVCSSNTIEGRQSSIARIVERLSAIRGPFALVFYDAINSYLYYGRDCLGRRSLLRKNTSNDGLILSSVSNCSDGEAWVEVEADGLYVLDLRDEILSAVRIPHQPKHSISSAQPAFNLPFPKINKALPSGLTKAESQHLRSVEASLLISLRVRVQHVRESVESTPLDSTNSYARIAVLFSGGLDCTVLARLCNDLLPPADNIDLLNVAFENPRIHSNLEEGLSPYELCPDRVTGRTSHAELVKFCPHRLWRFVEINVPYSETVAHRTRVMTLMHPHNTEMDLSISYALYFASRGRGLVRADPEALPKPYSTPAHVLISGLGADELFGGYERHSRAFARRGYPGLIDELELDFDRIGKRNLGRDDRVISDSGKEVRFPYLDEDFIALVLELPVWTKCDFANKQLSTNWEAPACELEPGKRILRRLAWQLDMKGVAAEKKRAIQFGARTAKMQPGKTKGTQILT